MQLYSARAHHGWSSTAPCCLCVERDESVLFCSKALYWQRRMASIVYLSPVGRFPIPVPVTPHQEQKFNLGEVDRGTGPLETKFDKSKA
ncbi:hypothetical protein PoB_000283700 [Plakobranchus ocellatus]|uniref:Uncharacterized protein n=1 Tax=Plakobranchus ocellatus TaxID=259542 RepID=A0AAV3Y1K1_9GAST|nr:hypothetical protein PoB_000283700 [Plakobranchus ocellatus]